LSCALPDGHSTSVSQYLDQWLKKPEGRHLTILGDFGTGKTWLCHHFVANQAKKCIQDRHERIPILVNLREYSKAYDIVQVITDLCANRLKIHLPAGYDTFDFLNRAGRFVVVFDGLDEMEQRISDFRSIQDNFWELTKVSKFEQSKAVLTSRTTYFENELEEK